MKIKNLEAKKRGKNFFLHDAVYVAKNILGDYIAVRKKSSLLVAKIVETESYLGIKDDASHSFSAKLTPRNKVLFDEGGVVYVYIIYGICWCFNIVVSKRGNPQSVFIRAVEPISGIDIMMHNRKVKDVNMLTKGPCRFTSAFGIDRRFLGKSLLSDDIYILRNPSKKFKICAAKRIGIDYANQSKNSLLRFYIKNNPFVSKKVHFAHNTG